MPTLEQRLHGGLVGLLVGDALGVPYEFHPPEQIPAFWLIEFEPPTGFTRAHNGVPVGTWSDDGAQALALLASLLQGGKLDLEDLGQKLLDWYQQGYMAVDGQVFDVGIQTGAAIRRLAQGVPAAKAGANNENANGNGSLMRVLPLALWHQGSDAELVDLAHWQSLVTHGHLRSQVCCAFYCLWARQTQRESANPWNDALSTLREIYGEESAEREELEFHIRPDQEPSGTGSGYVVDCLHSARWAMEGSSFEEVVRRAIALGNDTDTTACVAGGIAGIKYGIEGIPLRWRQELRGKELYQGLLEQLIQLHL